MKLTSEDKIFDTVKIILLLFLVVVTLYPFLNVIAVSLNEAGDTVRGGITIFPRKFTLFNYKQILSDERIITATVTSVSRTIVAVVTAVFCNAMVAYALSRPRYFLKKPIAIFYIITMYVSGGIIPSYFLVKSLNLLNTFTVYWFPSITSAFSIIIMRTYMKSVSESIVEAAKMEGANDFTIFIRIMLPLCKPVLATIALFVAVDHWNAWFDTFLYNPQAKELTTLQYELMKKLQSASASMSARSANSQRSSTAQSITPTSIRAAMTIVVSLPIILVYPFLQKYFVKGLTIGGVKG